MQRKCFNIIPIFLATIFLVLMFIYLLKNDSNNKKINKIIHKIDNMFWKLLVNKNVFNLVLILWTFLIYIFFLVSCEI